MSAADVQMNMGQAAAGAPGGDPPRQPPKRALSPSAPATPRKRRAATLLPCCRCLRSLQTRKGNTGGAAGTPVVCEIKAGRTRCARCFGGGRAGAAGCVPVPASLVSAASRLLSNNSALVVGAADAPTKAEVEAEADTLSLRMRTASANARRLVPGSPAVGGAGSPSSARGGASGDSLAVLGPLVGHLVEALRVGVEMYAQVNNIERPVWADEVSSDEEEPVDE